MFDNQRLILEKDSPQFDKFNNNFIQKSLLKTDETETNFRPEQLAERYCQLRLNQLKYPHSHVFVVMVVP